ncbi:unnamed protein product [Knipowitschia caucasica]
MAVSLRVVLAVDDSPKLTLPNGMPGSVDAFKEELKRQMSLPDNFRLQYRDVDFDNEFVNLSNISEIKDKSTIKVIYLPSESSDTTTGPPVLSQREEDCSFSSDTDMLSSPESTSSGYSFRSQPWPQHFQIPQFNYEV